MGASSAAGALHHSGAELRRGAGLASWRSALTPQDYIFCQKTQYFHEAKPCLLARIWFRLGCLIRLVVLLGVVLLLLGCFKVLLGLSRFILSVIELLLQLH